MRSSVAERLEEKSVVDKEKQMSPPTLLIAKVKGFPWWIARDASPESQGLTSKKDQRFVYFFGTKKYGYVKSAVNFFSNIDLVNIYN